MNKQKTSISTQILSKSKIIIPLSSLIIGIINTSQAQQIYINEFLASNVTINPDIVDFNDYSDWLEIYNAENHPIDLGGYYLTDDLDNPTKWHIPAGTIIGAQGFIRFWADGMDDFPGNSPVDPHDTFTPKWYHLNFKLSKGGEEIGLYSPEETLIDTIVFGLQISDVSYGRKPDGSPNWYYFGEPTPGSANLTEGILNTEVASTPGFSPQGGFYSGGQTILLSTDSPTSTIRYTTDGSRPSSASTQFTSVIHIDSTTVLRARVFDVDRLPGPIMTHTYLIDENPTIPVISISAFPETLWDDEIGIYINKMKEREIPIGFEYYESNGDLGFRLDAGLRLTGQGSYLYPQKPFTISARDRFGTEQINYQIFPNRNINKFTSIYLRNSGVPDNRHTMFRDALQHSIVINQMDLDCQAYRPTMTFLNGEYWGIYNIREKLNTDYIVSHHNIDPNNIDYLEYSCDRIPDVLEGDPDHYNALLSFLKKNDMALPKNYDYVQTQMDVDEYLNYQITEIYCDNLNWLDWNVRWWREKTDKGRWRWILVDLDSGFGMPHWNSHYTHNALPMATSAPGSRSDQFPWSTFVFCKLLENPDFKNEFIQRFATYLNTTFHEDRVLHIVDSLKSQISSEMVRHIDRWNDDPDSLVYGDLPIPNIDAWNREVEIMRKFAQERPAHQRQHIIDFFELSGTANLALDISESGTGRIYINNVAVPEKFTGFYFRDIPVQLKAIPSVGNRFDHWEGISNSPSETISIVLTGDAEITAVFKATDESILPSIISKNMILNYEDSPYLAEGDVVVDSGVTLQVQPGVEIQMGEAASIFVYGNVEMNGNRSNPIIIHPNASSGGTQWGALCIINATDPSTLSHVQIVGASRGPDLDRHTGAISTYQSYLSLDHVKIEDAPFPVFVQYGTVEIKNSTLHSDEISDFINIKYASSALVENCDLRGNISFDTDAIDYDQIDNGIIRGNRIYNFFGVNNDGIDLGEGSKAVLIENNLIFNCFDKGISVGQASTAVIKNNVIVGCAQGVGIKDNFSYALIDRNTFYGNAYPVACFEKNIGAGGGSADVVNCIFSHSTIAPYFVDALSTLNISYSLSDTDVLPGVKNINADPLFRNNFRLMLNSPAIDSGDPGSSPDPDGSRADMGAYYHSGVDIDFIIINEIHYNPANRDDYEFIELYNAGKSSANVSGFRFTDGIDFIFPQGSSIAAGEYVVIAKNASIYSNQGYQVFEWIGESLSNSWANIQFETGQGTFVDLVSYSKEHGWVSSPNGNGPSLELRHPSLENLYAANWRASYVDGGTPGRQNIVQLISDLFINEFLARNNTVIKDENNDYDDWIEIYNRSDKSIDIGGLFITDDLENPTMCQIPIYNSDLTTIQPHDFLLLWADGDTEQGFKHLNFKLSGNGEQIGLVQIIENDTIILDRVNYGSQSADVSYGRNPDGGDNWEYFDIPTPNMPNSIIESYKLAQNYPNPFNLWTYISYSLPKTCFVTLKIYNLLGREINILVSEQKRAGQYKVGWNAGDLPSGIYLYRLEAGGFVETKKLILQK